MRFLLGPLALLALLGTFLLPFSVSSVMGLKVVETTGYETAFGRKAVVNLPLGEWFGGGKQRRGEEPPFSIRIESEGRSEGNHLVAAAFIVGVLGGVLGLMSSSLGALGGIGSAVLFLVAQQDMQKEFHAGLLASFTFQAGFWVSLGCAAMGGILCLLQRKG